MATVNNPRTATVTGANPTPPTNITSQQGTPPHLAGSVMGVDPGRPWSTAVAVFAAPTASSVYNPEGFGTEVSVPFLGAANSTIPAINQSNSDLGSFTETPNKSHPSNH